MRNKLKNTLMRYGKMLLNAIQIISSIAAVAASIATCFTVSEMRNERNQLYKPQMIFESSNYSDDYKKTSYGTRDVRNLILMLNDEEFPMLETTIYNIGSGAAIDVEICFLLDNYKEYIKEITQYYEDEYIIIDDDKFTVNYAGTKFYYFTSEEDLLIKKPFVLSGESVNIVIPEEFNKLLYYLNCCTNGDYSWQPAIHLQISYIDVQGIKYSNEYEILIKTEISSSEQGKDYFHVDYIIEQGYYDQKSGLQE